MHLTQAEYKDHAWSDDFMIDRTADSRAFKILNIIDEHSRDCLSILGKRKITSHNMIDRLFELFILRGVPAHIQFDNGPEFNTKAISKWLGNIGVRTLYIEPGFSERI